MRNNFLTFSLLKLSTVIFLIFIASCSRDPAMPCIKEPSAMRKVLIETFTGHYDGHGAIVADTFQHIQQSHPDRVIGITIHAGYFAKLFSAPFVDDFRCDEGDVYYKFMAVSSNPTGTINRVGYPTKLLKNYTSEWARLTNSMAALPAVAALKISNQYNAATRILNASVHCNFLGSLTSSYKLVVLLTEDGIVAPQKDYSKPTPSISLQFVHQHVLRDGITGPWGDLLNTKFITKGDSIVKHYSYTLPLKFNGKTPNENNCHIIAYIYDDSTYEVLQAEEMKMMN